MKKIAIAAYGIAILYCSYLSLFMVTEYLHFTGREHMPFVIWIIDTIDLFIHEFGHPLFSLFGDLLMSMGGSIFQILLPAVTVVVFLRSGKQTLLFTLYWVGQSMINVSVYMADAPYRQLKLISKYLIHDWNHIALKLDIMDSMETIAELVQWCAGLVFLTAIGFGVYSLVQMIREELHGPQTPVRKPGNVAVKNMLEQRRQQAEKEIDGF